MKSPRENVLLGARPMRLSSTYFAVWDVEVPEIAVQERYPDDYPRKPFVSIPATLLQPTLLPLPGWGTIWVLSQVWGEEFTCWKPAPAMPVIFSGLPGPTVPIVNNHDTLRPILDANGNYGPLGDASRRASFLQNQGAR